MSFDLIDLAIISLIMGIIGIYAYYRYREEKHKEQQMLIPTLESYREKYIKERKLFAEKAETLRKKLEEIEKEFHKIKANINNYKWTEDEKEILRNLKGTEYERIFTIIFEILGFKVLEPEIYKDCNIDIIIETTDNKRVCVDFVDYTQRKKLNENYIKELLKGKEKYNCQSIWILTNRFLDDDVEDMIYEYDINLFEFNQLVRFFPSYRIVDDYDENRTKYHNFELLHKETRDEVIRRDLWIKEVEEKLEEIKRKRGKK
ncbi:restriction endonuclease [Persephonella sp.]